MKIFSAAQLREWDQYTIESEQIPSVDLMERAAYAIFCAIRRKLKGFGSIGVLVGPGNNGGDGLVLARWIQEAGIKTRVYLFCKPEQLSHDGLINYERFKKLWSRNIIDFRETEDFAILLEHGLLLDALFGNGLNRPLENEWGSRIKKLNDLSVPIWSIDIPSGMPAEWTQDEELNQVYFQHAIRAEKTFTIQQPKASFFCADGYALTGSVHCVDIGLSEKYYRQSSCSAHWLLPEEVFPLPERQRFGHKGTYGHGLLLAGSTGMAGAAVMAAHAALTGGIGLLSVRVCRSINAVLQQSVPQAMTLLDKGQHQLAGLGNMNQNFTAYAAGPGMGTASSAILLELMEDTGNKQKPLVLDADALNMMAMAPEQFFPLLGPHVVLTPHPGEFDRLTRKKYVSDLSRADDAADMATKYQCFILLKGGFSRLFTPRGEQYTCTHGSAALAKAGSGDVLSGLLLAMLCQEPDSIEFAIKRAMIIHALAGEEAAKKYGNRSLTFSKLLSAIGQIIQTSEKSNYLL